MQPLALVLFLHGFAASGFDLVEDFLVLKDVIAIDILIIKLLGFHLKLFQELMLDMPELGLSVLHWRDFWILFIGLVQLLVSMRSILLIGNYFF